MYEMSKTASTSFSRMPRKVIPIQDFKQGHENLISSEEKVALAGRIIMRRVHKKVVFLDLSDGSAETQIAVFSKDLQGEEFDTFKNVVEQGDILFVEGQPFKTRVGERSLRLKSYKVLTKAMSRPPTMKDGLQSEKRFLTLMTDTKAKGLVVARSRFFSELRQQLWANGYQEVETPVLEKNPIGSAVRQFESWHNALDAKVYLRVTPELYHKKLLVSGFSRIFEIGRVFRNEGISREHAQDYVAVEGYAAYLTFEDGVSLLASLISRCIETSLLAHDLEDSVGSSGEINWKRTSFKALLLEQLDVDLDASGPLDLYSALEKASLSGFEGLSGHVLVREVWRKLQASLSNPTIVEDMPAQFSPMGRPMDSSSDYSYEAKFVVSGIEVGHAFDELTDPQIQRERFDSQSKALGSELGGAERDFLDAIEYGLPPNFGFGFSERLVSVFAGVSIRDVQYFPLYK